MKTEMGYNIITKKSDFTGYEILWKRKIKYGVYQVHLRHVCPNGNAFFLLEYCKTELLPDFKWWKFWM